MNKIESYEQLKSLASKMLKPGVLTNANITEKAYLPSIEEGSLFYTQNSDGLFLFRKREGHFLLNFFLLGKFDSSLLPENTVFEIAFREKDLGLKALCDSLTLKKELVRNRLSRGILNSCECEGCESTKEGFKKIVPGMPELLAIKDNFNELTGCIPSLKEIESDIALKTNGGLIHYSIDGKTAEIKHMLVDQKMRGQGLSNKLVCAFNLETKDIKAIVWASDPAAIAAYEKNGFILDDRTSIVFSNRG